MRRFLPPIIVFALGAACSFYGVYANEIELVFNKAIAICMECIGIG